MSPRYASRARITAAISAEVKPNGSRPSLSQRVEPGERNDHPAISEGAEREPGVAVSDVHA
jgi:hypothetical protein